MSMILLTQEGGDPILINRDWIAFAIRISSPPHDFTNITMGNTTLTVREPLDRIKGIIQNGS